MLSWKEKEEDTKASKKKANTNVTANAKPAPRKKGKEPDSQPISNYLNLYEDIEDADDLSEAEVFKDVVDDADMSEPTTTRIQLVGTSWSAGSTDHYTTLQNKPATGMVPGDEPAAKLDRLKEMRLSVGD